MADIEDIELDLLLEGINRVYGMDFRQYARTSLRRRVRNLLHAEKLSRISALQDRILHDPAAMERVMAFLPVSVTTMFRDPSFFSAFREKVVPHLWSAPFVRIWHAGCATGEEVYSLAILLTEVGLYERCRIYATDLSGAAIERAKAGIYPLEQMQEFTSNYVAAGGIEPFSNWYTAQYGRAIFKQSLRKNIVFAQHNLATDGSFNEFNVILCRNVLIYFDKQLQDRVHGLLYGSLRRFGVLALGQREGLHGSVHEDMYEAVEERQRIYRRTS
ncbi:MAG: protein-glutamate O-methyltransferase CheR [Myxococcaceae bacterium]